MALKPKNDLSREEKLAKRDAAEQEALLREVDDAVRQGDTEEFMTKYGKPLLAVLVLGLVGFGGYLFWDARQEAAMERDAETLVAALDQVEAGNLQTGYEQIEALADKDAAGAAAAAGMLRAGIAAEEGRTDEAARLFAAVAANGDAPQALRDLAKLREIALRYDTMERAEIVAALKPLAVPGNAYFASAGELLAHAYLDQNNRAEAGALFAQNDKDDSAPEGLRSRSRQMAGVLGVDAIVDVDSLLEQQGVTQQVGEGDAAATAQ